MGEWGRETLWRQGHVLSHDAATALNLLDPDSPDDTLVIVISHDCDLASEPSVEPHVEVVVGKRLENPNGNCEHGKNVRKLHLEFRNQENNEFAELQATSKTYVAKTLMAAAQPRPNLHLDANGRAILQRWLSARYRRAAFPDEFDRRLKDAKLDRKIAKILEPSGRCVRAILFDVDEGKELTRNGAEDTYSLDIMVVHTTDPSPDEGFEAATKVCEQIKLAFKAKLYGDNGWVDIELRDCFPMSDEALTVRESERWKEWRLEHISLRQQPNQAMITK